MCSCGCGDKDKEKEKDESTATGNVAGFTSPLTDDGEAEDSVKRTLSFEEIINNFKEAINKRNDGS